MSRRFITFALATCFITNVALTFAPTPAHADNLLNGNITRTQDAAFQAKAGFGSATKMSLVVIVARIIQVLLGLLGVIFVVLIIYAGILWMTSAGNEEKIEKAKSILTSALIGLVIVLAAFAITFFVLDKILEATTGGIGLDQPLFN